MDNLDEIIKKIQYDSQRMGDHFKKLDIANRKNSNELDRLVIYVNDILNSHGISEQISRAHIRFDAQYISNIYVKDKKLSEIIFDHIFPKSPKRLYSHFTGSSAALNIIDKGELWLFSLLQNFGSEEFRQFYRDHGIDGYEYENVIMGIPTDYKTLMSQIFAFCLTTEENTASELWEVFGQNGTGVKLTFEIESKIPDYREVYYSSRPVPNQIPLLKDLFNGIKNEFGYVFNFSYMSRIGAFYIKGKFENEKEFRLIIKTTADNYNTTGLKPLIYDSKSTYISLPFVNPFADFTLKKVEKGPYCREFARIANILKSNYKDVEIIS